MWEMKQALRIERRNKYIVCSGLDQSVFTVKFRFWGQMFRFSEQLGSFIALRFLGLLYLYTHS